MLKIQNEINKHNNPSKPRFSLSYCEEVEKDIFLYSIEAHEESIYPVFLDKDMTAIYPFGYFEVAVTYKHVRTLSAIYSCQNNHEQRNNYLINKVKEVAREMSCDPWMEIRSTGIFYPLSGKFDLANPYQGYNGNVKTISQSKFLSLYKQYHSSADYVFNSDAVTIFKKGGLL